MRFAAVEFAAACILLSGCSSDQGQSVPAATTQPDSAASFVTLQCVNGMSTHLGGLDVRPVLGVVALPASPSARALATGRLGGPGQPRLFAKSALVVRKGSSFSLRAATPKTLGFSWNPHEGDSSPTRSLLVKGCKGSSTSGWLAFVGGYYVDRPSCVALVVKTASGTRRVKVGVGTPCAGQRPPLGPSHG
jgi:hypothetical protein